MPPCKRAAPGEAGTGLSSLPLLTARLLVPSSPLLLPWEPKAHSAGCSTSCISNLELASLWEACLHQRSRVPQALDHAGESVPPPPQAILSSRDTRFSCWSNRSAGQTDPQRKSGLRLGMEDRDQLRGWGPIRGVGSGCRVEVLLGGWVQVTG